MPHDPLEIAQSLIRCPSVTPEEAGALTYLQQLLEKKGFACHRLPFSSEGQAEVDNLFARAGDKGPHLCFAGHTDVVPPGDERLWSHPPFSAHVADGWLYGRGAADMKGGVACMVAAALDYIEETKNLPGSISFLITGDEEGPSVNGTRPVINWMAGHGHKPDHCLVGEPCNPKALGDAIKVGRRGSFSAKLTVTGTQGHSAYPDRFNNPIPGLIAVLDSYLAEPLDEGTEHFPPSHLAITAIETGNPAYNVVPAAVSANINIRFNTEHDAASLEAMLAEKAARALKGTGLSHSFMFQPPSDVFLTEPGPIIDTLAAAIKKATGRTPELSTGGGTSDARYIKDYCPVIEFGLVNATIHQIDERTEVKDLTTLTEIYRDFIARYFAEFGR